MITVDWGSTNFRAALLDDEGKVVDRISSDDGIKKRRDGDTFENTLLRLCGKWISASEENGIDIYLSGMIGSREGWVEAPYVATPASAGNLAKNLIKIPSEKLPDACRVWIVPGVRHDLPGEDDTDVMRGEETEVLGLLANRDIKDAVVCIPGTHSKWILCSEGKIQAFQTWLTGEAFDRLTNDSLLSGTQDSEPTPNEAAFVRGLERSGKTGGLLHHLFLGRTDMLMKHVAPESLSSLISGLLIGHEIRDAQKLTDNAPIHLIGKTGASQAYAKAFDWFGIDYDQCEDDVHTAGILEIAVNQ